MASLERRIRVLDPTSAGKIEKAVLAKRLRTLDGKAVGLLDNSKANSDVFLARVQELLSAQCGVSRFFKFRKETPARGVPKEVMAELAKCDAVINGIAD